MKSPEYFAHGTSSTEDAEKIETGGFKAEEGRATVSADLIYAFDWATNKERRGSSKSETATTEDEVGKIIVMTTPEDSRVDYANNTQIETDDEQKIVTGYTSKYQSGRKQLAIYTGAAPYTETSVPKENVILSIEATEDLGRLLDTLSKAIKGLEKIDFRTWADNLATVIEHNPNNIIFSEIQLGKVLTSLVESTVETEVVNLVRSLAMEIKHAKGYKIFNKEQGKAKEVDPAALSNKLTILAKKINRPDFDIGSKKLNRYLKLSVARLLKELKS